jgi:hypothetical protein
VNNGVYPYDSPKLLLRNSCCGIEELLAAIIFRALSKEYYCEISFNKLLIIEKYRLVIIAGELQLQ